MVGVVEGLEDVLKYFVGVVVCLDLFWCEVVFEVFGECFV